MKSEGETAPREELQERFKELLKNTFLHIAADDPTANSQDDGPCEGRQRSVSEYDDRQDTKRSSPAASPGFVPTSTPLMSPGIGPVHGREAMGPEFALDSLDSDEMLVMSPMMATGFAGFGPQSGKGFAHMPMMAPGKGFDPMAMMGKGMGMPMAGGFDPSWTSKGASKGKDGKGMPAWDAGMAASGFGWNGAEKGKGGKKGGGYSDGFLKGGMQPFFGGAMGPAGFFQPWGMGTGYDQYPMEAYGVSNGDRRWESYGGKGSWDASKSHNQSDSSQMDDSRKTTLMLRHIPNKYTQPMLLKVINEQGFRNRFDFFYLPVDFRNKCNVGYAFINFANPADAQTFKNKFEGFKLGAFNSHKVCSVGFARVQGLDENVEHYRNSPVMGCDDDSYKPQLYRNGERAQFPPPDGPLPVIRLRASKDEPLPGASPSPQQPKDGR